MTKVTCLGGGGGRRRARERPGLGGRAGPQCYFGSRACRTCWRIGHAVSRRGRNEGWLLRENYEGNYLMFSCKYTRFGKSVNHPGEDIKKLCIQVRGKGHRDNKCR